MLTRPARLALVLVTAAPVFGSAPPAPAAPPPAPAASAASRKPPAASGPVAERCIRAAKAALSGHKGPDPSRGPAAYASLRACLSSLLETGNDREAMKVAKAANDLFPLEPQSGYDYGALLLASNDAEAARPILENALGRPGLQAPPASAERALALNNLGRIVLASGDVERSRSLFKEALDLDPSYAGVYYNLAAAEQNAGDAAASAAHIETALARDPGGATRDDYLVAGWAYVHTGRAEQGAAVLRKGIAAVPNGAGLHFNLGLALAAAGHPLDALFEYLYELMNGSSNDPFSMKARVVFMDGIARPEATPGSASEITWLGEATADPRNGAAAAVLASLDRLEHAGRRHATLDLLRAEALHASGKTAEAEGLLRKILAADPAFLPPYLDLAAIAKQSGNDSEAQRLVVEVVRRNPGHWQLLGGQPGVGRITKPEGS